MDIEKQLFKILPDQNHISPTEKRNPNSKNLGNSNVNEILNLILDDTLQGIQCLNLYLNEIELLVHNVVNCLKNQGRLLYVGAGSSGRIALLDSLEIEPTFGFSKVQSKFFKNILLICLKLQEKILTPKFDFL